MSNAPTITKGELFALLAAVSDDIPLVAYALGRAATMNLHLTSEDLRNQLDEQLGSVAFDGVDSSEDADRTLTKGQISALLAEVQDETPLIVYSRAIEDYANLELTADEVHDHVERETAAIALLAHDNFDTRQW